MNSADIIMILALFLTMKPTTGQSPLDCGCYPAATPYDADGCSDRGCSTGNNTYCDPLFFDIAPYRYAVLADRAHTGADNATYRGCNCPGSYSTAVYNGYHGAPSDSRGFTYTTCTDYGGNARDATGNVPADANAAVDCCNYCCGRSDPYPSLSSTTATAAPTTTATAAPTTTATAAPTTTATAAPTTTATAAPTTTATAAPTTTATAAPTTTATAAPTTTATAAPTTTATAAPTTTATAAPTTTASGASTATPTAPPTKGTTASGAPTVTPTAPPTKGTTASGAPTVTPTGAPTTTASGATTAAPTGASTTTPAGSGSESILHKSIYLIGLTLLVLTFFKTN